MKKKIAFAMACILACGCLFASCGSKEKKPGKDGEGTSSPAPFANESVIPVTVSETQYMYATNADGSYETVVATDAEGNTHTYLKGIKAGTASVPDTQIFEIENSPVIKNFIDILNSGKFEMDGYITTDGEKMPLKFRTFGNDIRMGTEVSGIALDFALIGGTTYLISDKTKSYLELTESLKKTFGLKDEDMSFSGFGSISNDDTTKSSATYNGKQVDCFTASSKDGDIKFYVDGDTLVKIELYDLNGVCSTMIETTNIKGNLTADDLKLPSDYKKQSYVSFLGDVINALK